MLIPGNPVIAEDYYLWMQEIEERNNDVHMVYATSYILFDRKLNYVGYDRAKCQYHEKLLLELSATERVTIVAHSVGGYFALRLLEKYPERIERVVVMFPYIGYSIIWQLKFLWPLYQIDRIFPLAELVSMAKSFFKKWYGNTHNITSYDLTACLRFGVRQCVYFNNYKLDTTALAQYKDKIHFIYAENDRWCPPETIERLKLVSEYKKVNLSHDFIVRKDERLKMIDEIGKYL